MAGGRRGTRAGTVGVFVGLTLVVTSAIAFFVSPYASSEPDGLEKVAIDKGFDDAAEDHALADGPLADYRVQGVDDQRLSTGVAGIIGVALCFAIGAGVFVVIRVLRGRQAAPRSPVPTSPSG